MTCGLAFASQVMLSAGHSGGDKAKSSAECIPLKLCTTPWDVISFEGLSALICR